MQKYIEFKTELKKMTDKFGLMGDITMISHILSTIESDYKTNISNDMFEYVRTSVRDDITYDYESSYIRILKNTVEYFELEKI